jgi:protease I
MAKKILLITGDGGESYEALYARHRFEEAGYVPVLAAPTKKRLKLVVHDFEPGWETYMEKPGYEQQADLALGKAKAKDYVAVVLLGGRAPEYLRNDENVLELVRDFHAADKWIFSICHGIQILAAAIPLRGVKLTCYEHCRFEAEALGGEWINEQCVRDGRIVTSQTWQSHPQFYRVIFECLNE